MGVGGASDQGEDYYCASATYRGAAVLTGASMPANLRYPKATHLSSHIKCPSKGRVFTYVKDNVLDALPSHSSVVTGYSFPIK